MPQDIMSSARRLDTASRLNVDRTQAQCPRCGIRFDATGYVAGAKCEDCQDVTGERDVNVWTVEPIRSQQGLALPAEVVAERVRQVEHYTVNMKLSAREIAKRVGVSYRTIQRYRKDMSKPTPEREIHLRATMWRKEPAPPKRGSRQVIPPKERKRLYKLHTEQDWPKGRIERELGVHHTTMIRIVKEFEDEAST